MKIDKAIEIQTAMRDKTHVYTYAEINKALSLGVEALKAWQVTREGDNQPELYILPGETE